MGSTAKLDYSMKKYSNDSEAERFYTDLRNDIQDSLYGSFEAWKEMRANPTTEFLKEVEDIRNFLKESRKRDAHLYDHSFERRKEFLRIRLFE